MPGIVNGITKGPITQRALEAANASRYACFPGADAFEELELPEDSGVDGCYAAVQGGSQVGYVTQVIVTGFGGPVVCFPAGDLCTNVDFVAAFSRSCHLPYHRECTREVDCMKKIVLEYYSCYNLGDDLFVFAFAAHFSQCDIRLLVNPKCVPQSLPSNVKVHFYSYPDMLLRKLIDVCDVRGKTGMLQKLERLRACCMHQIKTKCDAYAKIGGSIFMQHAPGCEEIDFSTEEKPDFTYRDSTGGTGNSFIIGANLGPAYSENYWADMEMEFQKYRHICLRDYASYCAMRRMPNVQYAPDVLFLTPKPPLESKEENIVISVIDIGRHTQDSRIIDAYYLLLEQAISFFLRRDIPVTLASFCQWQGDERAVRELLARFPEEARVSACCYRGDPKPILEALAGASYIIGSRFHSVILGMSFGKPVFPIVYNCKTQHYLSDLCFAGRYAGLCDLPSVTLEDVLYNYQHQITADCSQHHRYAVNQFRGLEDYLGIQPKQS